MNVLNVVVCPGCGSLLPHDNHGCPDCGYENNEHPDGRLMSIQEILNSPSYPVAGAISLNDVSPAFIQAVVSAATHASMTELNAWRERFPQYTYRAQDECIALK